KKPVFVHAKPHVDRVSKKVSFSIESGAEPEKETTSGKGARCLVCGTEYKKGQVREIASLHSTDELPLAVVAEGKRGRVYLPSSFAKVPDLPSVDTTAIDQPMPN